MELYVGMDVDPVAHQLALPRIQALAADRGPKLKTYTQVTNFKKIECVLREIAPKDDQFIISSGVSGIFIDLGVSSMQAPSPLSRHH